MVIDRTKYMDAEEVKQMRQSTELRCLKDLRAGRKQGVLSWMVVDLALSTGLRANELAAIKVEDIDLDRSFIMVGRSKKKRPVREPLAIGEELAEHIREYLSWSSIESGPLLVGKRGPLKVRGLQEIWHVTRKEAGLPEGLSIHSARHTIAVHLLKKTNNCSNW